VFIVQAYQASQFVVPRGGKWRSSFAGNSDGKMNVQSACALNTTSETCPLTLRELTASILALTYLLNPEDYVY
jgi:hypothetical protein